MKMKKMKPDPKPDPMSDSNDPATPAPEQRVIYMQRAKLEAALEETIKRDPTSPEIAALNKSIAEIDKTLRRVEKQNAAAIAADAPKRAAQFLAERSGIMGKFPRNDNENKDLLAKRAAKKIRFISGLGYHVFDGQRFAPDSKENTEVGKLVSLHMHDLVAAAEDAGDEKLTSEALLFGRGPALNTALTWLKRAPDVSAPLKDFDSDPMLLNVANCTIDLATGEPHKHRPEDLITRMSPVAYDKKAKCSGWIEFLRRISATKYVPGFKGEPREDLVDFLQLLAGYCLTGHVREQVLFLFDGEGANGKSTFMNILKRLLGEYFVVSASQVFAEQSYEQHPTGIADLAPARVAWIDESPKKLNLDLVKNMTGEATISARKMRKDFFRFEPHFKLIFNTNGLPSVGGDNAHATWRRIIPVPFDLIIPSEAIEQKIETRLATELPGILNWAIEGSKRWNALGQGGLWLISEEVEGIKTKRKEYQEQEDVVTEYLEDRFTIVRVADCKSESGCEAQPRLLTSVLRVDYVAWARKHGEQPISQRLFAQELKRIGKVRGIHREKKSGKNWWVGLQMNGAPLAQSGDADADGDES